VFVPPTADNTPWRLLITSVDDTPVQADDQGTWRLPDRAIALLASRGGGSH
jgi:glycogen operon protein